MTKKVDFYNFPIELLQGVFSGKQSEVEFLLNILKFHIFKKYLELPDSEFEQTEEQRFSRCAQMWGFLIPRELLEEFFNDAESLYYSLDHSKVKTGISIATFKEYFNNSKTEFEWNCLIAFLALKSILLFGKSRKSTNDMLFARMNGFATINEYVENGRCELKRFRRQRVITELETNWNLKYYAMQTHGFYFGFEISLEQLMIIAETKKDENKKRILDEKKKKILEQIRKPP